MTRVRLSLCDGSLCLCYLKTVSCHVAYRQDLVYIFIDQKQNCMLPVITKSGFVFDDSVLLLYFNCLKCSGVRKLHLELFSAIQV